MSPHTTAATEIETASGQYVDLANPDPATIRLDDIAHGLAHTCRYTGQVSRFYSVAEHAVHVANLLAGALERPDLALLGLHHDDAEAYLGDLTRPLKRVVGRLYTVASMVMDDAIRVALNLSGAIDDEPLVKQADDLMLAFEAEALMYSRGAGWAFLESMERDMVPDWARPTIHGVDPVRAKALWLERHAELTGGGRMSLTASVDSVIAALRAVRFNYSTEFDLHDGLAGALERAGVGCEREVIVSARDRIDLMAGGVAIEVKVDGNTASVRRQVERYTEHDQVDAVLLVTNRVRHNALAGVCNGKPIRVYNLIHQAVA